MHAVDLAAKNANCLADDSGYAKNWEVYGVSIIGW